MSEIDPSYVRPMEVHLLRICEEVIKLKYDESTTNTKHKKNLCTHLLERMAENNEVFGKLFESLVAAGSYPDNIKISEPNEYDELLVLKFPSPCVGRSRPGYVTINVKKALRRGWNIGKDNYELFVDDGGYLIQNKVLNWLRDVVRRTLLEENNVIDTGEDSYEVFQSSNGPAVTLDVTVLGENIQFSVDLVGCLAFHSDEWWTSDKPRISGVWNAIPKPIKVTENMMIQRMDAVLNNLIDVLDKLEHKNNRDAEKISTSKAKDAEPKKKAIAMKKSSVKVTRPPSYIWYKRSKSKIRKNVENLDVLDFGSKNSKNEFTRSGTQFSRPNILKVDEKMSAVVKPIKPFVDKKVDFATPKKREIKREKSTGNAEEKTADRKFRSRKIKWEKSTGNTEEKIANRKSVTNSVAAPATTRKAPKKNQKNENSTFIPDPRKNREWICSYAEIERQFLKGTQTMKPLIRIFKKIRDNKQLTNLKSYFIKTIFLHHNSTKDNEYWQQSLAVLFMEMFDVILKHLREHRLNSFWHQEFNLFHRFRSGQIAAIYENLLKVKNDLIANLKNDNPDFIYEVVCTEQERLLLKQYV